MKATWWLVILIAGAVVLSGVTGSFGRGKKSSAKANKPAETRTTDEGVLVDGYGETAEAARKNALEKVIEVVEARLGKKFDSERSIPAHLVTPAYLEKMSVIAEDGEPEKDPNADNALRARYKVNITGAYLDTVNSESRKAWMAEERSERQERVVDRHLSLARVLFGVLAVLLVVTGYLRLEEATKGYYTTLLRMAAIGVLVATAVGLVMTL